MTRKKSTPIGRIVGRRNSDYATFLTGMKHRIQTARIVAGRSVNRELILLYWDIGQAIVEKQRTAQWGDSVVEQIAADLRSEFPDMSGFSTANIWRVRQFYDIHTQPEFLAQLARELSGGKNQNPIWQQVVAKSDGAFLEQAVPEMPKGNEQSLILAQVVRELRFHCRLSFLERVAPEMKRGAFPILSQAVRVLSRPIRQQFVAKLGLARFSWVILQQAVAVLSRPVPRPILRRLVAELSTAFCQRTILAQLARELQGCDRRVVAFLRGKEVCAGCVCW